MLKWHLHTFTMKNRIKALWAKKWVRRVTYLVVAVVVIYFLFGKAQPVTYETAIVSRGTVTEAIAATGQVKPKAYASLRFKLDGVIAKTLVDVGNKVVAGQTLAILDTSSLSKEVTKARADVTTAQVALENSDQDVGDTTVKNNQALTLLYTEAPQTIADIVNLTQQAYASLSAFYDTSDRLIPSVASPILNSQLIVDANNGKEAADDAMAVLRTAAENFPSTATPAQVDAALVKIATPLQKIKTSLTILINAVASVPAGSISATTLQSYKDSLATAQTNLNSAISKQTTTASNINDTKVKNGLNVNSSSASYRTAEANLEKAQATFAIAEQNLSDAYLRAPFSGTIATKSKQVGELVSKTDQVYYLIGEGGLEIVANVPEVDIAKIKVGNPTSVKLDAYGKDKTFDAIVTEIDPAETVVDGIATYKVKFQLTAPDEGIRSGMTAELSVLTAKHDDVLKVPQRAVKAKNGEGTVSILVDGKPSELTVKLGLRGNDSSIEITDGLTEGATVVVGTK